MTDWTDEFIEKELGHRQEQKDFVRASGRFLDSVKSALEAQLARHREAFPHDQISVHKTSSYELVLGSPESSEHKTFFQLDPTKEQLTLIGQWGGEHYPVTVQEGTLKLEQEIFDRILKKALENVLHPQEANKTGER